MRRKAILSVLLLATVSAMIVETRAEEPTSAEQQSTSPFGAATDSLPNLFSPAPASPPSPPADIAPAPQPKQVVEPAPPHKERAQACRRADALGTSRVQEVGTSGGLHLGLKTYPKTLDLKDKEVVLTFDDGPNPGTTDAVLDALRNECVKATFFLVGRNSQAHPSLVRREIAEGHTVGHHSWSHPVKTLRGIPEPTALDEITHGISADQEAGYGLHGADPVQIPFFRFPGFADTPALRSWLDSHNIAIFGADLWASDWNLMTPEAELKLLMQRLNEVGRGIILLHDARGQTARMLPMFLRELKKEGYRVVHIVPGHEEPTAIAEAPPGWSSETEAILAKVMPKLLRRRTAISPEHGM